MKERPLEGFGQRLASIRKQRGSTQIELGEAVGVSNRVIAYYEQDGAQPPGAMLVDLADFLDVSTDELLGRKPVKKTTDPKTTRLLDRLQKLTELPPANQRAVLEFVALLETHGVTEDDTRRQARG